MVEQQTEMTETVFVIIEGVDYDGESIVGIYDDSGRAIAFVEENNDDWNGDYIEITEYPIGWNLESEDQENGTIACWTNRKMYTTTNRNGNNWKRIK